MPNLCGEEISCDFDFIIPSDNVWKLFCNN